MAVGPKIRLNRYLAASGVAARRKADQLIAAGRVKVNGQIPPPGGVLVTPGSDRVLVDGHEVRPALVHHYFAVHKPAGYLSAVSDHSRRPVVTSLLRHIDSTDRNNLHPVGRLDLNSSGLMILTDDGELSYRLQHPRYHIEKEYEVTLKGRLDDEGLTRLRTGIDLAEGRTAPTQIELSERGPETAVATVVLRQGWKRQIRRMFHAVGCEVVRLHRVRIGPLWIEDLSEGAVRRMHQAEVDRLREAVGLQ